MARFANGVCPASYFPESHRDQRRAAFLAYLAVQHNLFRCVTWFEPGLHIWAASKVSGMAALLLSDDGKSPGNSIWSCGSVLWNTAIKMLLMLRSNWLPLPFDGVHQR
jgi:hypothetical protein